MIDFFININPIYQSIIMCTMTFLITALGSSTIFIVKKINENRMNKLLSISAGIMLSSSIFSLIIPAINNSNNSKNITSLLLSTGIILGTLILYIYDKNTKKDTNLIVSMTIHNFPEGIVIGVAFASVYYNLLPNIASAISLAIGIGIQNFPEGAAISFPLYNKGINKKKAFFIGSATALPEIIGGIIGTILTLKFPFLLSFFLSFAFGSMLYVIITELIPETMSNKNKEQMVLYFTIGFIIMMILDITLG